MQECQNLGSCKHLLKFNTYSHVRSIVENTRLKWINEIGWKDLESVCDWANRISMQMNLFSHFQAISARVVLPMLPPPPKDLKPPTHTFLQWEPPSEPQAARIRAVVTLSVLFVGFHFATSKRCDVYEISLSA